MRSYSISELVEKYKDLEYIVILDRLEKELKWIEGQMSLLKSNQRDEEYRLRTYIKHGSGLLYFLRFFNVPAGIGLTGLRMLRPIIENLVEKKNISSSALEVFQ